MSEIEIKESDQRLAHTVFDHLIVEAYSGLLTALDESIIMKGEDERYAKLHDEIQQIMNLLDVAINEALDEIPGLPSREEAEKMAREAMDSLAITEGFPVGSLTPPKETLH